MSVSGIKQRFGIIGNSAGLNQNIDIAVQVAATDLSVLITGESGSGKEVFPQIIHQNSSRKHNEYIAVNCGAIPGGTIDSELFGHEKGAFTGAVDSRKGYFEVANGGTIFLDEVGELPIQTQARLLRVLESGEFIKVGSSKVKKTDVRIVAATNVKLEEAVRNGKFREDLYYRLNTVPIKVPPLRERREDIHLLFRKFSVDFADKYRMPPIKLSPDAVDLLISYRWPGNIRQLKNVAEQISVIEENREISKDCLLKYLPSVIGEHLPVKVGSNSESSNNGEDSKEREVLYKVIVDMKKEINSLKKVVLEIVKRGNLVNVVGNEAGLVKADSLSDIDFAVDDSDSFVKSDSPSTPSPQSHIHHVEEVVEESLSLAEREKEFIEKALEKHRGRRKNAASELGISERTLYRKIKEYDIK